MADEKPKTLQEQSSPTGPPVSQEGKDTALAVVQPGEEKDKTADTKSVEAKGTEAAGSKKLDDIVKEVKEPEKKVLGISHCNCPERAEIVRDAILERIKVKDSVILDTRGVSSMYANDGGVIVVI